MTLPTTFSAVVVQESPCPMLVLAAAAARVDARPFTYGPLWGARMSTKTKPKVELLVYDVFCMVFLDRPGAYYRVDQIARTTRGRITTRLIIEQLRIYHRVLHGARTQNGSAEVFLTNREIKDWWMMPPHVRASLNVYLTADPMSSHYDYGYVPFLQKFIPKRRTRDAEYRFFNSFARYLPLLLSADIELRSSPALWTPAFTYGVFASRPLKSGEYTQNLRPLCGELVSINNEEHGALTCAGADFSVLELDEEEASRIKVPGKGGKKRQRVRQGPRSTS
jgi:hypothetical protein